MGGSGDRHAAGLRPGLRHGSRRPPRCERGGGARALRRSCLLGLLAVVALLASSGSALAAGETEHVFERKFKAEGGCAFVPNAKEELEAGDVAVDEATGEIFVFDRGSNSVDRFSSAGACLEHFKLGTAEKEKGKAGDEGLAVDNSPASPSFGDVYVVKGGKEQLDAIYKLKVNGEGKLETIAEIETFNEEGIEQPFEEIRGLAVDASGGLWVYQGKESASILRLSNAESNTWLATVPAAGTCPLRTGFAVEDEGEAFYVARNREGSKEEHCEAVPVMVKLDSIGEPAIGERAFDSQLDNERTTGVAVDSSSGEVYFDNQTSVAAFSPDGKFVQRFGQSGEGQLQRGTGIAALANGYVYAVDAQGGEVKIYEPGSTKKEEPPIPSLADNRGFEQVTPTNKLGSLIFGLTSGLGSIQASEDGNAITYVSNAPIVPAPPSNRAPEPTQNISRRGSSSWSTEDVMSPAGKIPAGYRSSSGTQYEAFSPDLSKGLINLFAHMTIFTNEPLLSPEATEDTQYIRNLTRPSSTCEPIPSDCYEALVSPLNDSTGVAFGTRLHFASATSDLQHAVLRSEVPLTPEAQELLGNSTTALYEWSASGSGVGTLQLVSQLPALEPAIPDEEGEALRLGGIGENFGGVMRNAISSDGQRVIWSTHAGEGKLFLRDTAAHQTIRLDLAQGAPLLKEKIVEGSCTELCPNSSFQTADAEGTKIFFTDTYPLTSDASVETGGTRSEKEEAAQREAERGLGDLYVCEVPRGAGLACTLRDLTPQNEAAPDENARVQGVIGASEDGNYIYFVANSVLAPGAGPGKCEPEPTSEAPVENCSLYVAHFNGSGWDTSYIATLTSKDEPDWHVANRSGALATLTSRVSPSGEYLAFMSASSLTGYNNVDSVSKVPDEEVFLYKAAPTPEIVCPSCKQGAQPAGILDQEDAGEGTGLAIDRPGIWRGHWLAANIPGWTARSHEAAIYQSRYLSDTGRLFFNAVDGLVPADENGKADVYEYEREGQGTCTSPTGCVALMSSGTSKQETAFLDASLSGDDVFFLTSAQLVPQDQDSGFDIYDAHVCTSSPCFTPPPEPKAPCTDEGGCKGSSTSQPALPGAPPSSQPGPGNAGTRVVLGEKTKVGKKKETRAQKLAKALKACKKIKNKKKRKACVRSAKKRYGAVKHTTHKKKK
jgi:hypothetical protein